VRGRAGAPAPAADIDASSRIGAVTLYSDAAVVTRTAEVDLPAGASRLVFHALPGAIYPDSLRASGEGDQKFLLGAIATKRRLYTLRTMANRNTIGTAFINWHTNEFQRPP
jgi:hypothetical protein